MRASATLPARRLPAVPLPARWRCGCAPPSTSKWFAQAAFACSSGCRSFSLPYVHLTCCTVTPRPKERSQAETQHCSSADSRATAMVWAILEAQWAARCCRACVIRCCANSALRQASSIFWVSSRCRRCSSSCCSTAPAKCTHSSHFVAFDCLRLLSSRSCTEASVSQAWQAASSARSRSPRTRCSRASALARSATASSCASNVARWRTSASYSTALAWRARTSHLSWA
mmetsp:Transcript_75644/g.208711  ORF Transcript_75644/g.208711 Transcript_75644/m.208711 type:complete len:229 (-) Transcript_75644:1096-1782(-)